MIAVNWGRAAGSLLQHFPSSSPNGGGTVSACARVSGGKSSESRVTRHDDAPGTGGRAPDKMLNCRATDEAACVRREV